MILTLIDNYDSFTWNLVQYFGDLGVESRVYRNDKVTAQAVIAEKPRAIVISPGPCDPASAGICLDLIKLAAANFVPLLGVCLGHQAIGEAFGGKVVRGDKPMHGKISEIAHKGKSVFSGLPSPYPVTRYHSLIVERKSLPKDLGITAETGDGVIMGLAHKTAPIHGVQFHPESIATAHGHALLKNFVALMS